MIKDYDWPVFIILLLLYVFATRYYIDLEESNRTESCEDYNLTYESCNRYETCVTQEQVRCIEYTTEGLRKEIWIQR